MPLTRRLAAMALMTVCCLLAGPASAAGSAAVPADPVEPVPAGPWGWPLYPQPEVLEPFVAPAHPYGPGHRGVDLAGAVGQPVLAVSAGRVSFAGQVAGRGVVVVDHGRFRTTYEPVLVLSRNGEQVRQGEAVGTLVLTGGHCLPVACLHLGVRDGERYVDPLGLLGSGRVRLLPLDGSPPVSRCCPAVAHPAGSAWWVGVTPARVPLALPTPRPWLAAMLA